MSGHPNTQGLHRARTIALAALTVLLPALQPASVAAAPAAARARHANSGAKSQEHAGDNLPLPPPPGAPPHVEVPALTVAPRLEDFTSNAKPARAALAMLRVSDFIERYPADGAPSTERTEAYLGYTREHLYIAFVCKDSTPRAIRAHMLPRDSLSDDDSVQVYLDTFHDSRRSFLFKANALGIQADALYSEQNGADFSFDTVWDTWGRRLPDGYAVLMRIPFASLRFESVPPGTPRTWGILLQRNIARKTESVFWPQVRHSIAGQLTQEATADGFQDIERGRSWQVQPYGLAHSFRQLNVVDPNDPVFNQKKLQGYAGIDLKSVIHNSLVLDLTFNPDFSQIGINDPAPPNQRFQYYYPELRPFFLENSSYFQTPLNLYYTPNVVRPQFGARLTGKVGNYALGILAVDDRDPGLEVPATDPSYDSRSFFYVGRLNRDIGNQSNVGLIFADHQYRNSFNRNGGLDYRTRVADRWTFSGQMVTSATLNTDNSWQSGQAWVQGVSYSDLHTSFWAHYSDVASGYLTQTGFFTRPDVREPSGRFSYTFHPKHGPLQAHSFSVYTERIWDHTGLPLEFYINPVYTFNFKHRTNLSFFADIGQERLRPSDYSTLTANVEYHGYDSGIEFYTSPSPALALWYTMWTGQTTNYSPPANQGPTLVNASSNSLNFEVKPARPLDLVSSYAFGRFTDPATGLVAYDNHQIVERWNFQMDKAWSLNFIGEYQATLPNAAFTSVTNNRDVYGNLLLTYLPHPGTAFYVGFTTDYVNLDPSLCTRLASGSCNTSDPILPRTTSSLLNDQHVFYMKVNHLFRF